MEKWNLKKEIKIPINTDNISGIMTSITIILDIIYVITSSVSLILDAVIMMWVLILLPTVLVYMRGDGSWKRIK